MYCRTENPAASIPNPKVHPGLLSLSLALYNTGRAHTILIVDLIV